MKSLLFICSLMITQNLLAEEKCPILQGEYVANACPVLNTNYNSMVIRQPDCRAIGFQNLGHLSDGKISFGQVTWEPIGTGKLLMKEDSMFEYLNEKFFDSDSLYSYSYKQDKSNHQMTLSKVDVIDVLKDGNLFISYSNNSSGMTWFNLKNCK